MTDTERKRIDAICEVAGVKEIDDLSDGFHTFRQLYYQRMMLFATIVKQNKDKAWKSLRHEDGELCFGGGWFIVGIDTPEGSYTYHYEDNYFSLFDCVELERSKHWDGHTEKDVTRLLSLSAGNDTNIPSNDTISRQDVIELVKNSYYDLAESIEDTWAMVADVEKLPSAQPERKKPVFKTGESVYHVSYADGTGGFEKNKWADWTCPDCGWFVGEQYIPRRHNQQKCNYCAKCGCAIDWSDADMRGEQDEDR